MKRRAALPAFVAQDFPLDDRMPLPTRRYSQVIGDETLVSGDFQTELQRDLDRRMRKSTAGDLLVPSPFRKCLADGLRQRILEKGKDVEQRGFSGAIRANKDA